MTDCLGSSPDVGQPILPSENSQVAGGFPEECRQAILQTELREFRAACCASDNTVAVLMGAMLRWMTFKGLG